MIYRTNYFNPIRKERAEQVARNKSMNGWHFLKPRNLPENNCEFSPDLSKFEDKEFSTWKMLFTDEEYFDLYKKGLSDREAAHELGVSPSAIVKRRRVLGLGPTHGPRGNKAAYWEVSKLPPIERVRNKKVNGIEVGDFLELLGWYVSEGSVFKSNKRSKSLTCSIGCTEHVDEISGLLSRIGVKFRKGKGEVRFTSYELCKALKYYGGGPGAKNKKIDHLLFSLPKSLLRRLFESMMRGDGHTDTETKRTYHTTSERLARDFIWLSNYLGYTTNMRKYTLNDMRRWKKGRGRHPERWNTKFVIELSEQRGTTTSMEVTREYYEGLVYDITIEDNHNFFAGEDGQFVLVGNCDEWLDSLAVKVLLTQKRIDWARERIRQDEELGEKLRKMWAGTLEGKENPLEMAGFLTEVLEEIDETSGDLYWKLKSLLEHRDHAEFEVSGKSVVYFIPDPKIVLNRLLNKVGGKFLLMSATCQSPDVLENVFGIEPAFVEGETKFPGQLIQRKLGEEEVVNYQRWADEKFRRRYWNLLSRIMRRAKRPSFVPVHAFKYLPEKLREEISAEGIEVYKHQGIVFTTKMDRGADLKGMKSIIITKFPYPEREDPLLKGMERRLGKEAFWDYYRDMAERNFVQQVGRVLRSDEDVVEFWSPDGACHAGLRSWKGSISVETVEGSDT
jgi:hypothetical protein